MNKDALLVAIPCCSCLWGPKRRPAGIPASKPAAPHRGPIDTLPPPPHGKLYMTVSWGGGGTAQRRHQAGLCVQRDLRLEARHVCVAPGRREKIPAGEIVTGDRSVGMEPEGSFTGAIQRGEKNAF